MSAPFSRELSVIETAEELAVKADIFASLMSDISVMADAYRARIAEQQREYLLRRDLGRTLG